MSETETSGGTGLSLILPAYNEAGLIGETLERLAAHLERSAKTWEIVVVDDGSTDGTDRIATGAASRDPRVRLIRLESNRGKGAAVARGLSQARGGILVVTDADLSYSLEDLDAAAAAIREGADVAAGSRDLPGSRINLPFGLFSYLVRRWLAGAIFRLIIRVLLRPGVTDTQCGLKAVSRSAAAAIVPRLRTRRYLTDIEILLAARGLGMKVAQVPVHLRYLSRDSRVRLLGDLPGSLVDLARILAARLRGGYRPSGDPT